ncbi:exodeoxyribonuclease V subunit gamma [Colwellia sp. 4_MG-2023]|uniref:exodeoxyribonuclease V subunit gamma n=1 Tax=unclassified Colwellia TaxID=196834 RepID=UPI0026E16BB7|nr:MULTISPECIES: exodeoxyribonuclease V subunit gamma [unclassified Colwellia]MDO6508527.1 exodeoxyribonuclease V subunit gamma [Colwellia sp. 5_MG-2023]MDO6557142.1 exodeoxyribonuclease V subunit gamma [Colwellia sp. 4_MG-2023]
MINLYPANKMENLLLLLNKISQLSPLGVFSQEVIVVQNPGMQHWLNLAIAEERGISMNMGYALPAQYLWKLIRTLASDEDVPEQSPYSREVLTWRIYALLATKSVIDDSDFIAATRYWHKSSATENAYSNQEQPNASKENIFSSQENLKRYQLAEQMADLYEQYLIFRPEWLDSWQKGQEVDLLSNDSRWQAKLWQQLIKQLAYNPVELLNNAIANIENKLAADPLLLPKRLSFFGINSMAPMWLTFINALSEYIEVDFYHLNPCFSYWGDIISEKQAISKLSHWSNGVDDEHLFVGNPLLANLGQQGREFLALLQDYSTVNVELFVKASSDNQGADNNSISSDNDSDSNKPAERILHKLQNDILALDDATKAPEVLIDDSITFVSCHSALREVQALHDFLLHQFNESANQSNNTDKLTPKDVLVMCPQIEQYAPYVNAVFTRGWQDLNDEVPPLPCSIADRSAKDSDPLIAAFSELLTLPDSRFQVSHLLSFIRLPAVANKFSINEEDGEKIAVWLKQATVHWGLDKSHKAKILGDNVSNSFTWQQGLSRLLRGFAFSDSDSIYQEQLLLAAVEGDDAILLGQLMLFIEQLQSLAQQLNTPRTAKDWQTFLLSQLSLLFTTNRYFSNDTKSKSASQAINAQLNNQIENSLAIIEQAISALVEYCSHAHFEEVIDLAIVVDFLNNHFSQGDASRQFMVGQVTFCSMLPMRSIPFKIIAVLGLNDGEFPRQRQPLGFDLMATSPARLGDRSRRGDDRYLFLEAIISARNSLYLSYQGRNIKNNNEKQPSLVLKELMDYLTQGYGWNFDKDNEDENPPNQLQQMPMQPFSEGNYLAAPDLTAKSSAANSSIVITASPIKASFNANWFKLAQNNGQNVQRDKTSLVITDEEIELESITANDLIRFFQHPSKMFAQKALNLYLDDNSVQLHDVEPFSADYLDRYLLKQDLLTASLAMLSEQTTIPMVNSIEQVLHAAKLSGKFPDAPSTQADFDNWLDETQQFSQEIVDHGCDNPELIDCQITVNPHKTANSSRSLQASAPIILMAKIPVKQTHDGVQLVFYRSSVAKVKDLFTLFLHHLIVQLWQQQNMGTKDYASNILSQVQSTCGFYFNAKAQSVEHYSVSSIENAEAELNMLLSTYEQGQKQALLLNSELAAHVFKQVRGKAVEMTQDRFEGIWYGDDSVPGLSHDPYIAYFWQQCPDITAYLPQLNTVYQSLFKHVSKRKSKAKGEKS